MDILHVLPTLSPGGAQNIAIGLARAASCRGLKSGILVLDGNVDPPAVGSDVSFDIHPLEHPFRFRSSLQLVSRKSHLAFSEYLRCRTPDVIHSHLFLAKCVIAANPAARRIATVDTVHDNLPWWRCKTIRHRLMTAFDRYYAKKIADVSIAISRSVFDDLLRNNICNADRCGLITNFIDTAYIAAAEDSRDDSGKRILIASRIAIRKKGLDTAVAAIKAVHLSHPDLQVDIIGDGTELDRLKHMVSEAGLSRAVSFHGHVTDPLPFYRRATVLLMPSRWEGFGLTAAEALATGLPVVASNVGGLRDVVRDNYNGVLCEPDCPEQFATAVNRLLDDAALQVRFSANARASARACFSVERAAEQYINAYERAVSRNGGRRV